MTGYFLAFYCVLVAAIVFIVWGILMISKDKKETAVKIEPLSNSDRMTQMANEKAEELLVESQMVTEEKELSQPIVNMDAQMVERLQLELETMKTRLEGFRGKTTALTHEMMNIQESAAKEINRAQDEIRELKEQNQQLNNALMKEAQGKDSKMLSGEVKLQMREKESLLHRAQNSVEHLTEENHAFKKDIASANDRIDELERDMKNMLDNHADAITREKAKVIGLEMEARKVRSERDKAIAMQEASDSIVQKNKELVFHIAELEKKVVKLEAEYQAETSDKKDLVRQRTEKLNIQLDQSLQVIEQLKKEKAGLEQESLVDKRNFEKIKEFNNFLLDKEKMLQFELNKSRAQIMGLEKTSEELKTQAQSRINTAKI